MRYKLWQATSGAVWVLAWCVHTRGSHELQRQTYTAAYLSWPSPGQTQVPLLPSLPSLHPSRPSAGQCSCRTPLCLGWKTSENNWHNHTVHSGKVNFCYDDDDVCFYIALFPTREQIHCAFVILLHASWTKMETIQIFYCIHAVWEGELMQSLSHTQTLKSPDHHNMTGIHQSPA